MEFKRINQETVRCILDEEDLIENNIRLEDLFKNTEGMQEFLHMLVEKAGEEVGYEPKNSGMVSMQIMPMPRNRVSITITDNADASFAGIFENIKSAVKDMAEEIISEKKEEPLKSKTDTKSDIAIVAFEGIDNVFAFCKAVKVDGNVATSLFYEEENKRYHMIIKRSRASRVQFEKVVLTAADYGVLTADSKQSADSITEYTKCVVKSKAIETMRELG